MNFMSSEKQTYWKEIFLIDNFLNKLLKLNREKIHKIFLKNTIYNNDVSILDCGTSNTLSDNHNIILQKTKSNKNIDCFSNQIFTKLFQEKYNHVRKYINGDGLNFTRNEVYKGEFKDGLPHGRGITIGLYNYVRMEGNYHKGQPDGKFLVSKNGYEFEIIFRNGEIVD